MKYQYTKIGSYLFIFLIHITFSISAQKDSLGFESIFDGKTLANWDGDPTYWRVENGCLVGEVTPSTILKQNSFIIFKGSKPKDFELKVTYRVSDKGNSGINYRSKTVTENVFALQGYQADIDGQNQWSGQNYEERGRTFLALRGQAMQFETAKSPVKIATIGDEVFLIKNINSDWNEYHLIVKGNLMMHIINGQLMSLIIDNDTKNNALDGFLGVQVHVGPPMKIEYKNFRIKYL